MSENQPKKVRQRSKKSVWAYSHYQSQRKPDLEQLIGREFASAAIQGNMQRLGQLVALCAMNKERLEDIDLKHYPPPWHYFVGVAACRFFINGVIPYKKDVVEAAIQHRAIFDAQMRAQIGGAGKIPILFAPISLEPELRRLAEKLNQSKPNWTRVFKDLGLRNLPSAPTHPRL
jgi:hypothetical protein